MVENKSKFENYFSHLQKITFIGMIYKRFYSSLILFFCARLFGQRIAEIGPGAGNGILGSFSNSVHGFEINPLAVEYCKSKGLSVDLIELGGAYPAADETFDVCVLDNVLEHIDEPKITLDECYRITKRNGGLVIVVPGLRGFQSDSDHKVFYGVNELRTLDNRWQLTNLFSLPFIFKSKKLSNSLRQYCLVATYRKI